MACSYIIVFIVVWAGPGDWIWRNFVMDFVGTATDLSMEKSPFSEFKKGIRSVILPRIGCGQGKKLPKDLRNVRCMG